MARRSRRSKGLGKNKNLIIGVALVAGVVAGNILTTRNILPKII